MNLEEVKAFLTIVRMGTLSKAAEHLYITQPTLSYRIQSLEKNLGFQLLVRSKGYRSVELTLEGREFISLAEKMCILWEDSKKLNLGVTSYSVFRIAATQTLSNYVMPKVYAMFVMRNLPVILELFTLHYRESYGAIENRSVDAVFVSRTISSNKVSAIHICSEKMVLLCSKTSSYSDPIHPLSLPQDKGIYMLWNHSYAMWHEYWFGNKQHRITADNMRLVEELLMTTDMWSIVPISAARSVISNSNLRYLPLLEAPPDRPIYMLTLEPKNPYTQYLIEDLVHVIQLK